MISVEEALSLIKENVSPLKPVRMPLSETSELVLAEDVSAHINIPAFPQSSMDGYAFSFDSWQNGKKLKIVGEIPAGKFNDHTLDPQQAVRIFTGAVVPEGADTVVKQELTDLADDLLVIRDLDITKGENVRPIGSEIKTGEIALYKNKKLSPPAIGFLAGIGVHEVLVYPKPSVSLIVTGNELQVPGQSLQKGQVYESTSFSIKAVLEQLYIREFRYVAVKDDLEKLKVQLNKALAESDLVMLAGGVSVGDYDYVPEALSSCGVSTIFHKVKQRPGKPLFFGKTDQTIVFGLPGNPASVLTCFYEYVLQAIEIMTNEKDTIKNTEAVLSVDFTKNPELTYFLKGSLDGNQVTPLGAQESYRMRSFADANCLIRLDEGKSEFKRGENVDVQVFLNNLLR